jgi:hypothetical protein
LCFHRLAFIGNGAQAGFVLFGAGPVSPVTGIDLASGSIRG